MNEYSNLLGSLVQDERGKLACHLCIVLMFCFWASVPNSKVKNLFGADQKFNMKSYVLSHWFHEEDQF